MKNLPISIFLLAATGLFLASCEHADNTKSADTTCKFDSVSAEKSRLKPEEAQKQRDAFHDSKKRLASNLKDSSILKSGFNLPETETFSRDAVLKILSQKGIVGVRAVTVNVNGRLGVYLVGVDSASHKAPGNAASFSASNSGSSSESYLASPVSRCPDLCD